MIALDATSYLKAFPFHLVLDQGLKIVQLGPVISRLLPGATIGSVFLNHFTLTKPQNLVTFIDFSRQSNSLCIFKAKELEDLRLKCQIMIDEVNGYIHLLAVPVARSMSDLANIKVSLNDFPHFDSLSDFLLVVQMQTAAMADAERISQELAEVNAGLERRVADRTREIEASKDELRKKTEDVVALNERMAQEMDERKRIEGELHMSQKLEAVGQLAAGVAHEINTPVQFVGDNLRFLKDSFSDIHAVMEMIPGVIDSCQTAGIGSAAGNIEESLKNADFEFLREEIPKAISQSLEGIGRIADIVGAMKEFSHPDGSDKQLVDINHSIENTLVVTRNEYKYVADVVTDLDKKIPNIPCFSGEISQVFLNIIVNGSHAIKEVQEKNKSQAPAKRGVITVSTRLDGDSIEVRIGDTGTGIPQSIRDKVFNPFFTTKPVGIGTGQGLYLVHNIVCKRHGGTVHFDTNVGTGTTFVIRLPIANKANN